MKNQNIIVGVILLATTTAVYSVSSKQQQETKSVAWYTANVKEARQKNKACYDDKELQSTEDCKNALHALDLVYVGVGN
jgi:hypothetical protein